jgi:hypothetical protein
MTGSSLRVGFGPNRTLLSLDYEPIRAGQLRDLRWSTLPFGDGSGTLVFALTATKKPRHDARHLKR